MIIAFCGGQEFGKDTAAKFLIQNYGFRKLSFAGILKDVVSVVFSWDRQMLEGETPESRAWREKEDPYWSKKLDKRITPRLVIQEIGTDVFRNHFNKNIWIYAMEKRLLDLEGCNVVITDLRFQNEYDITKKLGGKVVRIERDLENFISRNGLQDYIEGKVESIKGLHESEYLWLKFAPDFVVNNNGTVSDLNSQIEKIIN